MKLNDYPVIHREAHEKTKDAGTVHGMETVLMFRENHEFHPFVVAIWAPAMGNGWHQGDYCASLPAAMDAFEKRTKPYRSKQQ